MALMVDFKTLTFPFEDAKGIYRKVIDYDYILVVGDDVRLVELVRGYRLRGISAELYPLSVSDSPTIYSLLGIVGLLYERMKENLRILVEGYDGVILLKMVFQLVQGLEPSSEDVRRLATPLHVRSIAVIESLKASGINLLREARLNKVHAFTGGDAHASDTIEHVVDIVRMFSIANPGLATTRLHTCIGEAYQYYRLGKPLSGLCTNIVKAAGAFDSRNVGAIKTLALAEDNIVAIGCKYLDETECIEDAEKGFRELNEIGRAFNMHFEGYALLSPEEAACIGYKGYRGYEC